MARWGHGLLLALFLLLASAVVIEANLIALDFGSQYVKASFIKTSLARPQILENEMSKRKTPMFVGFKDGERYFGEYAASFSTRFPSSMFTLLQRGMGRRLDENVKQDFASVFLPYVFAADERRNGSTEFVVSKDEAYSGEELMGMFLKYIQGLVKMNTDTLIRDVAISIPPFYTVEQRQALADAAALADMNLLALIPEHEGITLGYAIAKLSAVGVQNVLFYEMGAGSTSAFVVSFNFYDNAKGKFLGEIDIKSVAWDKSLGGLEFDARIVQYLAQVFKNKFYSSAAQNPVLNDAKAMAKLMKAANKAKEVLSVNKDTIVSVESLFEDKDLSVTLTRDQLEELWADLLPRVTVPIKKALEASGIPLANISAVEMVGGSSRVPCVQDLVRKAVGREDLGFSLNADEALVIGSAYRAAAFSPLISVKTFKMASVYPHEIGFVLSPRPDADKPEKFKTLFWSNSTLPLKKSIAVQRKEDFSITIQYSDEADLSGRHSTHIMKVDVKGVKEALESKHPSEKAEDLLSSKSKIKVTFSLDKNGVVVVEDAKVQLDEVFKVKQGWLSYAARYVYCLYLRASSLFSSPPSRLRDSVDEIKADDTTTDDKDKNATPSPDTKTLVRRVPLTTVVYDQYLTPLTKDLMKDAKKKFEVFAEREAFRKRVAKALNELESFIYNMRDKLEESESVQTFSTEDEREELRKMMTDAKEWLDFENDDSDLNVEKYENRLAPMRKISERIENRIQEHEKRPEVVKHCEAMIRTARNVTEFFTELAPYSTEEERQGLLKITVEVEQWLQEKVNAQSAKALNEDPLFSSAEVIATCSKVPARTRVLTNKPKPKEEKKKEEKIIPEETETGKEEAKAEEQPSNGNDKETGPHDEL